MYLLIPSAPSSVSSSSTSFTFHNVSINSNIAYVLIYNCQNLHSIMYLLILNIPLSNMGNIIFTFHNVSINSNAVVLLSRSPVKFTFHNVSINSLLERMSYCCQSLFTFHNVSINSVSLLAVLYGL